MSLDRSLGFIFHKFGQKSRSSCDIHHYIDHDAPRLSKLLHKHFLPISWVLQSSQEKSETMVMQNVGGKHARCIMVHGTGKLGLRSDLDY